MSYRFLPAFVMGWVFGLMIMWVVRIVVDNDLFGILGDCAAAWYDANARRLPSVKVLATVAGTLICGLAAAAVCLFFTGSRYDALFPLGFITVVLVCARYFGPLAGTFGSILAAGIFARFYPPDGFAVDTVIARTAILLMVGTGSAFSWFLAASREHKRMRTASSGRS
jgi:hypothetical protein